MAGRVSLSAEGRDHRPAPDRQENAMFINPHLATRLAREHQRELLAEASQRQLAHRSRPAPGTPGAAGFTRRLAAAVAWAGVVAAGSGRHLARQAAPARRTSRARPDARPQPLTAAIPADPDRGR
jgi:hypothetical protein